MDGTLLGYYNSGNIWAIAVDGPTVYGFDRTNNRILVFAAPEPGSLALLGLPLFLARRRRSSSASITRARPTKSSSATKTIIRKRRPSTAVARRCGS